MTETENKAILGGLLSGFSTADVGLLMPFLEAKEVAGGTVVITHGGKDADVYFLLGGSFSVLEKVNINGSAVILNTASFSGPSILGEVNMLNQTVRTATVVCRQSCTCYMLSHDQFDRIVDSRPKLAIKLLKLFGSMVSSRQIAFQHSVRANILKDSRSVEAAVYKLGRYTGKVYKADAELTERLFSADLEGTNYNSFG
jgi:CRP-like cAMP-binding protein